MASPCYGGFFGKVYDSNGFALLRRLFGKSRHSGKVSYGDRGGIAKSRDF